MVAPDPLRLLQRQALDYRNKAEELRVHAEALRNRDARRILFGLADDADRMARVVEDRLQMLATKVAEEQRT